MLTLSPPTAPRTETCTCCSWPISSSLSNALGVQETMNRDWLSLNRTAAGSRPSPWRRSQLAPVPPSRQLSATATARPPSATSWADCKTPSRIIASTASQVRRSSARSSSGGLPATWPRQVRAYSEPPSSPRVLPISITRSFEALNPARQTWATSSMIPTIPTTGGGQSEPPLVSLYRLTLPETTGTSSCRQASAIPSTDSLSCQ